jgi:hypothetical protein
VRGVKPVNDRSPARGAVKVRARVSDADMARCAATGGPSAVLVRALALARADASTLPQVPATGPLGRLLCPWCTPGEQEVLTGYAQRRGVAVAALLRAAVWMDADEEGADGAA